MPQERAVRIERAAPVQYVERAPVQYAERTQVYTERPVQYVERGREVKSESVLFVQNLWSSSLAC